MIENLILAATITPQNDVNDTHEINTPLGVVGIRAGENRCWINSSLVTEDSVIFANLQSVDQTATSAYATECSNGSFVLRLNAEATSDVRVGFLVTTPQTCPAE